MEQHRFQILRSRLIGYCRFFSVAIMLISLSLHSIAQSGNNDPDFNSTDIGFGYGDGVDFQVNAIAVQSDGKIVIVGGFTNYNTITRSRIARLNADGSLDVGFNPGSGTDDKITSVVVLSDGKILIGGRFKNYNNASSSGIARLNPDGSRDVTFNPGTGANTTVNTLAVQSDGKILIGGMFTTYNDISRIRIARLYPDGSLDGTFDPGTGTNEEIRSLAVQSDGKILIGGEFSTYNSTTSNRIARLNTDGSLDGNFNLGGAGASAGIRSIAIQTEDGKILIGGDFSTYNGTTRNSIARLETNGTLDPAFNPGTVANREVYSIVVQTDGRILIGGGFTSYNNTTLSRIARLESNGTLDGTFNPTGANAEIIFLTVQSSDNKILIGGRFTSFNGIIRNRIARLESDGSLVAEFNPNTGANANINALAVQSSDGKILIGGAFTSYNDKLRNSIARLNIDGSLDITFSPGLDAGPDDKVNVNTIAVQSDGKILIGGSFTSSSSITRSRIARLNADGSLDVGFNPGSGADNNVNTIVIQSDGKILIGGVFTSYDGSSRNRITRLNSVGTLDVGFNPGSGANGIVHTIAVQSDGKILIGGAFTSYNGTSCNHIARLNTDGSLDGTFTHGTGASDDIRSIAVQSDGKILIGGAFESYNGTTRKRIARLNTDGSLDGTFDPGWGANSAVFSIVVQSNGNILIGGEFSNYNLISRNFIARLNTFGILDEAFVPVSGANSTILSIAVQSGGKILIGGMFTSYNGTGRNRVARIIVSDCENPNIGGTIAADQSGPSPFDPAIFTSSSGASGHTGTLEYKWQLSTTSSSTGFTDITPSNSEIYDAGALSQTTWFRRLAHVSCKADWTGAVISNVLKVTTIHTWNGSVSTDWNNANNWTPAMLPPSNSNVLIPSVTTGTPVLTGNIDISGLTVASGSSLDLSSYALTLIGNLSNSGTITASSGTLNMNSTSTQSISGTGTIASLTIFNNTGVTISSGDGNMLTITGMLSAQFGTLITNGNLTLKSDATGTARVYGRSGGGYLVGNVTTQRYLKMTPGTGRSGRAWRMVSIPVTGTGTLRDFFMASRNGANLADPNNLAAEPAQLGTVIVGNDYASADLALQAGFDWLGVPRQVSSLRRYVANSTGGSFASDLVPVMSTTYSSADQGYAVFARGDRRTAYFGTTNATTTTLQATGELKQGELTVTIPALATAGYVLVGNPYMSLLDMEAVYAHADNLNIIEPVVYLWDANIDGSFKQGGYRTITRTGTDAWTSTGAGANPQYIESGVAFFVKPKNGGTLTIKESHKVSGTPGIQPLGTSENGLARLFVNLEVKDTGDSRRLVDGVVAFFDDRYKVSLEDAVDIRSMSNMGAVPMGWRQAGERLAMQGRPWPVDSTLMSMELDTRSLGTSAYLLRLKADGLKREGFTAWLKDGYLKHQVALDLEGETLYEFRRTGDAGVDSGRFEILYRKNAATATASPEPASDMSGGIRLYPNPSKYGDVRLSLLGMPAGTYHVQVMDVLGRVLGNDKLQHPEGGGSYRLPKWGKSSTGRYVVRVTNEDGQPHTLQLIVE